MLLNVTSYNTYFLLWLYLCGSCHKENFQKDNKQNQSTKLTDCDQCMSHFMTKRYYLWSALHLACQSCPFVLCVVRWGRLGVSVSPEHHDSALPDHDPPLRPQHIHGPQKDSLQRLHFRWDTVTEKRTPWPFNYGIIHSLTEGFCCGFVENSLLIPASTRDAQTITITH